MCEGSRSVRPHHRASRGEDGQANCGGIPPRHLPWHKMKPKRVTSYIDELRAVIDHLQINTITRMFSF